GALEAVHLEIGDGDVLAIRVDVAEPLAGERAGRVADARAEEALGAVVVADRGRVGRAARAGLADRLVAGSDGSGATRKDARAGPRVGEQRALVGAARAVALADLAIARGDWIGHGVATHPAAVFAR